MKKVLNTLLGCMAILMVVACSPNTTTGVIGGDNTLIPTNVIDTYEELAYAIRNASTGDVIFANNVSVNTSTDYTIPVTKDITVTGSIKIDAASRAVNSALFDVTGDAELTLQSLSVNSISNVSVVSVDGSASVNIVDTVRGITISLGASATIDSVTATGDNWAGVTVDVSEDNPDAALIAGAIAEAGGTATVNGTPAKEVMGELGGNLFNAFSRDAMTGVLDDLKTDLSADLMVRITGIATSDDTEMKTAFTEAVGAISTDKSKMIKFVTDYSDYLFGGLEASNEEETLTVAITSVDLTTFEAVGTVTLTNFAAFHADNEKYGSAALSGTMTLTINGSSATDDSNKLKFNLDTYTISNGSFSVSGGEVETFAVAEAAGEFDQVTVDPTLTLVEGLPSFDIVVSSPANVDIYVPSTATGITIDGVSVDYDDIQENFDPSTGTKPEV